MTQPAKRYFTLLALLSAAACSSNGGASDAGDGGLPNICNSVTAAQGDMQCELDIVPTPAADAGIEGQLFYIDHPGKTLWLWIQLPATVPPRTLFHLVAGYDAPSTPVDLSIHLLAANLSTNLGVQTDTRVGSSKPGILEFTFSINPTTTPPGSLVWAEITDATGIHDDVHNPFSIYVDLVADPDPNVDVTPINLGTAGAGGVQVGTCANGDGGLCQGVLSVAGREDTFSLSVPAGINRPILYLDVSAPTVGLYPPVLYDLAYLVTNDAGTAIHCAVVTDPDAPADLSTALLLEPGGNYTIDVFGLQPGGQTDPCAGPDQAAGDNRVTYALQAWVMPDLDTNEPDDNIGQTLSHAVTFTAPGTALAPLTGRLAYVGDSDWYNLSFPASAAPTRLHYKITAPDAGGRYPTIGVPIPGADRIANLALLISGTNASNTCLQDPVQCPRDPNFVNLGGNGGSSQQSLFDALCTDGDGDGGALCLLSGRNEPQAVSEGFAPLQNFEGIFPLQGTGAQTLYLDFQSTSGQYADDIPYTLELDWELMPGQPPSSMTSPIVSSLPFAESGVLAAGYGDLVTFNLDEVPPQDVRGQSDYDAIPSNVDTYEVDIPAGFQSAPLGATWGLSWTLTDPTSGMPAESLELGVIFCTAAGVCDASGPTVNGIPGAIAYAATAYQPWWDPNATGWYSMGQFAPLWDQSMVSNGYSVSATPFSCTCFQPDYLAGGKFYVTVQGADRTGWTDTNYALDMSISAYPGSFGLDGGFNYPCPVSYPEPIGVADAGGVLVDAGTPQGCEYIDGFIYQ